jgi:hypothetical protein
MKTVIVFREGQSGHYLKSVILKKNLDDVKFRMIEHYPANNITLTHTNNYDKHKAEFDLVLRVLPTRRIYYAIYNNFMKKLIAEEFSASGLDNWYKDPVYWHDRCYYNIVEYHDLITMDMQHNCYPNVVDFDQLLDSNYLTLVLTRYFQIDFDQDRDNIRQRYKSLQLPMDLDQPSTRMEDITTVVPDDLLKKNPWFFSYCIHKYEQTNNFTPKNRRWSINDIHQIPTKQLLLALAQQYSSD